MTDSEDMAGRSRGVCGGGGGGANWGPRAGGTPREGGYGGSAGSAWVCIPFVRCCEDTSTDHDANPNPPLTSFKSPRRAVYTISGPLSPETPLTRVWVGAEGGEAEWDTAHTP